MHKIFFAVMMLSAAGYGGPAAAEAGQAREAGAGVAASWFGSYDSVSGRCGELRIQESSITWGSCRDAAAKPVSVTKSRLVMTVDPAAGQCGWAGFVVVLENEAGNAKPEKAGGPVQVLSAYQSLEDYKAGNRYVQCSFSRTQQ